MKENNNQLKEGYYENTYYRWFFNIIMDSVKKLAQDVDKNNLCLFDTEEVAEELHFLSIKPILDILLSHNRINDKIVNYFIEIDVIFTKHSVTSKSYDEFFWTVDAVLNNPDWHLTRSYAKSILFELDEINNNSLFNAETMYEGKNIKCILLATFATKQSFIKKILFFNKKKECKEFFALVYIPWKHKLKELKIIPIAELRMTNYIKEEFINIDKYTSIFIEEAPYMAESKIERFNGLKLIYENNDFIANLFQECFNKPLEILYKEYPEYVNLEIDEE